MESIVVALDAPEAADPKRFGPKAANLAALGRAGLPVPGGYAVDAGAYRIQLAALGLSETAREVFAAEDRPRARRCALDMKLGLMEKPIAPQLLEPLLAAWREVTASGRRGVVRSSALVEDRADSSFAGQFESFLELQDEGEFLVAVRACWAALWSTRALRYMATHDLDPADTAMAVLIQPLVAANASGGGLSRTATGEMLVSATWGLGSSIAQGEVTPDRFELSLEGELLRTAIGQKDHTVACAHRRAPETEAVSSTRAAEPCLNPAQVLEIGRLLKRAEDVVGVPVEIEWAMDAEGFKLLQPPRLHLQPAHVPDETWLPP